MNVFIFQHSYSSFKFFFLNELKSNADILEAHWVSISSFDFLIIDLMLVLLCNDSEMLCLITFRSTVRSTEVSTGNHTEEQTHSH